MSDDPPLDEKVERIHDGFRKSRVRHAFGGALALAYYAEPRGTIDIDVNVFVEPAKAARVFLSLRTFGVEEDAVAVRRAAEDGQCRVRWGVTPIDIFFATDPFHRSVAKHVRTVPFGDATIPVLGPEDLVLFKAAFARRKDWIDIEQVLFTTAGEFDLMYLSAWARRLFGDSDARLSDLRAAVERILGADAWPGR